MYTKILILFSWISIICIGDVGAQNPSYPPINKVGQTSSESWHWQMIGPFKSTSSIEEISKEPLPEILTHLTPTTPLNPVNERDWISVESKDRIDLNDIYGLQENAIAYLVCVLDSDEARLQNFLLGVNDEAKVWINGKLVFEAVSPYRLIPDEFHFSSLLNAGSNVCVVQVRNRLRTWDVSIQTQPTHSILFTGNLALPNDNPASWAHASITDASGKSIQTNANNAGTFTLVIPSDFKLPLTAQFKSQHYEASTTLQSKDPTFFPPTTILRSVGTISGRVFSKGMMPLSNAEVALYPATSQEDANNWQPVQTTLTNDEGEYAFTFLDTGAYQVKLNLNWNLQLTETWSESIRIGPKFEIRGLDFIERDPWLGHWTHFSGRDGLASMANQTIFQDSQGFLWFGSGSRSIFSNGISRYDGKRFQTYPIKDQTESNSITSIAETSDGSLWFGTLKGLRILQGSTLELSDLNKQLPHQRIQTLLANDNMLWIGTDAGLVRWQDQQTTIYTSKEGLPHQGILDLAMDQEGLLWIGTKRGAAWFDGEQFNQFSEKDGLLGKRVEAVHVSAGQIKWFGTEKGVTRYDGEHVEHYSSDSDQMSPNVYSIDSNANGTIWIGTKYNLYRMDQGHLSALPNTVTREMTQGFESVLVDHSGNVWVATGLGGVYRYQESLKTINTSHGLPGNIVANSHYDKNDQLWIGTQSGLSKFSEQDSIQKEGGLVFSGGSPFQSVRTFQSSDGIPGNRISVIEPDGDSGIWIGTGGMYVSYNGLAHFKNGDFSRMNTRDGLPNGRVHAIVPSGLNEAWIGTANGFCKINTGLTVRKNPPFQNIFTKFLDQQDIQPGWIYDVIEGDDQSLWLATSLAGAFRVNENGVQQFTIDEGLPSDRIQGLAQDHEGRLWLATFRGITVFDGTHFKPMKVTEEYPDHRFEDAFCDSNGTVWFASWGSGVFGYDGQAWTQLDEDDGLADNRVFTIEEDRPGLLHFSTANGLTSYRPIQNRPSVSLHSLQTDKGEAPTSQLPVILRDTRISLKFNSIDFNTAPNKRQYRIRIMTPDQQTSWGPPQQSDTFEWIPQQPGKVVIEAQSIDRDLNYSDPIQLNFNVVLPWYRNAWIIGPFLCVFFGISGTAFTFVWRFYTNRRNSRKLERQTHRLKEKMLHEQQQQNESLSDAKEEAERANRAKTVFLANMSHEIRTPMNAILGYAQILTRDSHLTDKQRGAVQTISESGKHLLGLINNILDLSKIEAEHVKKEEMDFDLCGTINGLSAMFHPRCQAKGLDWEVIWRIGSSSTESNPIPVKGDETKLRQILINLISNAIKFTKEGSVSLSVLKSKRTNDSENVHYHFCISDTGCGIPDDEQKTILDPFQQGASAATVGGTGLGLAIVKRHVELLGGSLRFESSVGKGSKFEFTLPFEALQAATTFFRKMEVNAPQQYRSKQPFSALIIDDVQENREVLSQILIDMGARTRTAESGEQGLLLLNANDFDIVFLDIRMPGRDGFQIIREIRQTNESTHDVRTVAISASTFTHEEVAYKNAGFDSFVSKPFLIEDLISCLKNLLGLEFEYQQNENTKVWSSDENPPKLPSDLLQNLRETAESYQTTEFKELLDQVRSIGPQGKLFADHLSELAANFNMKQIIHILNKDIHE
ncbi:ATP-binding protein [bacterium]|nr:ATP-binding protein [bacterium]